MAGYRDIHPHQSMVRAGEGEGAHQREERVVTERPEDTRIEDAQLLARQHIIGAQVAGRLSKGRRWKAVEEIGCVKGRISQVQGVRVTLQLCLLRTTLH